ncbi:MAG: hypothetical protein JXA67_19620 [Micromonosporaceae bacterium]|nr:hypothetical protein [Micromonosporaceae bacterium]
MTLASEGKVTRDARDSQRREMLGLMAAGVVHDVNNLLTIIGNYASFAIDAETPPTPPDEDRWRRLVADIEQIQRAAARGSELTSRLLAFARPGAGAAESLAVNGVVRDALALIRGALGKQIEIVLDLDPDCRPVVFDRTELDQVLVNLIINARDAMPGGGALTLRTRTVGPAEGRGRAVRIAVIDSGEGIPPEVLTRVFEPFFSTKPAGQGSGLGLAVVREIVDGRGGQVLIDSLPGNGTTVELLLPAA